MKKLAKEAIEQLALKMRAQAGLNPSEPIHTKTLLRKLGVMVIYRPPFREGLRSVHALS